MGQAQEVLSKIVHLAQEQKQALSNQTENVVRELDLMLEHEIGEKERALGALRQHCNDHGC